MKRGEGFGVVLLLIGLAGYCKPVVAQTFTTFDYPGSVQTELRGIDGQ